MPDGPRCGAAGNMLDCSASLWFPPSKAAVDRQSESGCRRRVAVGGRIAPAGHRRTNFPENADCWIFGLQ